ncbi:MAG: hypothetical protein L6Q33_12435 [Bacteriovoracaceae bacterium]|nr:hypothetical protein [Bacteriovoracaceae bacterium]
MKFLEKIEDAINAFLEKMGSGLWHKFSALTPQFFLDFKESAKEKLPVVKEKIKSLGPKFKIILLKILGTIQHYIHLVKGVLHGFILYLKSDDFKKSNKKDLLLKPVKNLKSQFKINPVKTSLAISAVFTLLFGTKIITKEMQNVAQGLKALRAPASNNMVIEEDVIVDLNSFNLKKVSHGTQSGTHAEGAGGHGAPAAAAAHGAPPAEAGGGGHAAPPPAAAHGNANSAEMGAVVTGPELEAEKFEPQPFNEVELIPLSIRLKFENSRIKNSVATDSELLHEINHAIEHIGVPEDISLPLDTSDKEAIVKNFEQQMRKEVKLKKLFQQHFSWEIDQEEIKKPKYHLASLRQYKFENVSLQLLLEDTKRNKQVYIEFVTQTKNREGVQILKHHDVEVKDYLMMNVEPVVPGLPLDDEGKRIIRDKIKFEINNYLKHHHLETEVEDVFIDYILAS